MVLVPFAMPNEVKEEADSEKSSYSNSFRSESSSSSISSNSSLSSQPSLPLIPSLTTTPPQHAEQSSTTHHHCLATLKGHSSYVFSLALSRDHLYSSSSDSEIRVWSRDTSKSETRKGIVTNKKQRSRDPRIGFGEENLQDNYNVVAEGNSAVKCMMILGDNKLISAHQDHKIRVWRVNSEQPDSKYKCVAALPTVNDRCMKLFLPKNYVQVRRHKTSTWVHHVDTVAAMALSKDGSLLYSASWDRTFKVWRTSDFKCLESSWNAHDDAINAMVLSNDGQYVYTGSGDKKIKVWRKRDGEKCHHALVATLEEHKSAINALALSSVDSLLYSGACDRSIIVWERDGGEGHMVVVGALRGHGKAILCLAVVCDLVFSGSADKTIRVWRRGVGKSYSCLAVLEGHTKPVKCLTAAEDRCISTDSNNSFGSVNSYMVYSGSLDCDIKIWRILLS